MEQLYFISVHGAQMAMLANAVTPLLLLSAGAALIPSLCLVTLGHSP